MPAGNAVVTDNVRAGRNLSRIERWIEKSLVRSIFRAIGAPPLRIAVAGRAGIAPSQVSPRFTLSVSDPRTLAKIMLDPEIGFGDAWTTGSAQVSGDLVQFLETVFESWQSYRRNNNWYGSLISSWLDYLQSNTLEGSRSNIHAHYDLGNDFYRMWLDDQLVYTCAYFTSPSQSLEQAQIAKLDHICRKLRLEPGETVAEAGCGWGALALHMARFYGVKVKAFNISREQLRFARDRARQENLETRVEFIEDDYRNLSGSFDALVSIGMLEHAGPENYCQFGQVIRRAIGDRGRGLIHFIGRSDKDEFSRWIRKRIFPGAYAPSLGEALQVLEPAGYFVQDVENLRPHYARTLEHWLHRFEKCSPAVAEMYNDEFVRAWTLYLAGSMVAFRSGTLQLFQILFSGAKCATLPPTRDDLYC
jgi:cyclopropane-fatty-acyl-phospholipid synthase